MTHLNPLVTVLDSGYHTFNSVHDASPLLLSSILAVSSRFFRKNMYASLINHAQSLLSRAVGEWGGDITLVQAIIVLVYFKVKQHFTCITTWIVNELTLRLPLQDHGDTTAWLKIGHATRLARQLRLHDVRSSPLPIEDIEARQIIDRERTWIILICFDIT